MSRRHRLSEFAAGGCLALALLITSATGQQYPLLEPFPDPGPPQAWQRPEGNAPKSQAAESAEKGETETIESLSTDPIESKRDSGVACDEECQTAQERERDKADLAAQEKMARAADRMNYLTVWQIIVGGVALIGLGLTVHYSRHTAKAAIRATKAAVSVELPIIIVSDASLQLVNNFATITKDGADRAGRGDEYWRNSANVAFHFTNKGRTIAIVNEIGLGFSGKADLDFAPKYQYRFAQSVGTTIEQADSLSFSLFDKSVAFSYNTWKGLFEEPSTPLWLFGFISFTDFIGESHLVGFCMKWQGGRFVNVEAENYTYRS